MPMTMFWGAIIGLMGGVVIAKVLKLKQILPVVIAGAFIGGLVSLNYAEETNLQHVETPQEVQTQVLKSTIPVMVDFYTETCPACKILEPTFRSLSQKYHGRVSFVKIDAEKSQQLAIEYEIRGYPTVILFVNGQIVNKWLGALPSEVYSTVLESVLSAD